MAWIDEAKITSSERLDLRAGRVGKDLGKTLANICQARCNAAAYTGSRADSLDSQDLSFHELTEKARYELYLRVFAA